MSFLIFKTKKWPKLFLNGQTEKAPKTTSQSKELIPRTLLFGQEKPSGSAKVKGKLYTQCKSHFSTPTPTKRK